MSIDDRRRHYAQRLESLRAEAQALGSDKADQGRLMRCIDDLYVAAAWLRREEQELVRLRRLARRAA